MLLLSRPRRQRRASDWTSARAVTFVVTLAAHRSVTLAAARAGMSRKSAYALKGRDAAFAAAWDQAVTVGTGRSRQGDKAHETHNPRFAHPRGNRRRVVNPADPGLDLYKYFLEIFANRDRDSDGPSLAAMPARP